MSYISKNKYGDVRTGEQVDELLTKIEDLDIVTHTTDGIMLASDKEKLDGLEVDIEFTTEELDAIIGD